MELAEFNLDQPIKEVDPTSLFPKHNEQINKTKQAAASKALLNNVDANKAEQKITQQPDLKAMAELARSEDSKQLANNVQSIQDIGTDGSENSGWKNTAEANLTTVPPNQSVSANNKRLLITEHSSPNVASDNLAGWGRYGREISVEAAKLRKYPPAALSGHMQGSILLSVRVSQSGEVSVSVRRSSGFDVLDNQALLMVNQAVKNVSLPPALKNQTKQLFIPIQFSL